MKKRKKLLIDKVPPPAPFTTKFFHPLDPPRVDPNYYENWYEQELERQKKEREAMVTAVSDVVSQINKSLKAPLMRWPNTDLLDKLAVRFQ